MLTGAVGNLLRISGLVISAILILSPWFISGSTNDPFQLQSWMIFIAGFISISVFAVVGLFFRPSRNQIPYLKPILLAYIGIVVSTLYSPYLVTLRTGLIWCTYLGILLFLRLARKQQDNFIFYILYLMNGFAVSIYALFQYFGKDIITWSTIRIVSVFANKNYFAAYLLITCLLAIKFLDDSRKRSFPMKVLAIIVAFPQFLALYLTHCKGAVVALIFALFLYFTSFWERPSGKALRRSPMISGLIISIIITILFGVIVYSTDNYSWQKLNSASHSYSTVITRLLLWKMGFISFLKHPFIGSGLDSSSYILTDLRPVYGTQMSLSVFNDTIHSSIIKILAELGFAGLFCFSCMFSVFLGIHHRKHARKKQSEIVCEYGRISPRLIVFSSFLALILSILSYTNLISSKQFLYSIPIIMFVFLFASIDKNERFQSADDGLDRIFAVSILAFIFLSVFNNNITVLPLLSSLVALISLHTTSCVRDIKWKRKFSYLSLAYICFPLIFSFCVYVINYKYQSEQELLYKGASSFSEKKFQESVNEFKDAIKANPQSLQAYYGLAFSYSSLNKIEKAKDIFKRLDSMVPNVFNCKLELAKLLLRQKNILEAHRYALMSLSWCRSLETYEVLGKALLLEGKIEEAKKILKESLLFIPVSNAKETSAADRIRLLLASIAAGEGRFSTAEKFLKSIKRVKYDVGEYLYLNGLVLFHKNKNKEALSFFERALRLKPNNPNYMNAVGYLLTEENINLSRAEFLLELAYKIYKKQHPPRLSDILTVSHSLGKLYAKQNKLERAEKLLFISYSECPIQWKEKRAERFQSYIAFLKANGKSEKALKLIREEKLLTGSEKL